MEHLRGYAILGIFLLHSGARISWSALGVSIFFVLSAFLLNNKSNSMPMARDLKSCIKFSVYKIKRLYPLFILATVSAIFNELLEIMEQDMLVYRTKMLIVKVVLNLFLVQSWVPTTRISNSLTGVGWFLSTIMFLYLIFPILQYEVSKISLKNQLILVLLLTLFQLTIAIMLFNFELIDNTFYTWLTYVCPITRIYDFVLGIVISNILKVASLDCISQWKATICDIGILGITILILWMPRKIDSPLLNRCTFFSIVAAFWVLMFYVSKGSIARVLCNRPIVWLGNISATFFLVHLEIIKWLGNNGVSPIGRGESMRIVMIVVLLLVSIIITELINMCKKLKQDTAS